MTTIKKDMVPLLLMVGISMVCAILLAIFLTPAQPALGSVARFAEYQATTTTVSINNFKAENVIQTGPGTLGSVVITGAAAGTINIYDATTSNINLRTGQAPTSTILEATIPNSAAAGVYTFDSLLVNGLYVSITGTMPTSTITYRQN